MFSSAGTDRLCTAGEAGRGASWVRKMPSVAAGRGTWAGKGRAAVRGRLVRRGHPFSILPSLTRGVTSTRRTIMEGWWLVQGRRFVLAPGKLGIGRGKPVGRAVLSACYPNPQVARCTVMEEWRACWGLGIVWAATGAHLLVEEHGIDGGNVLRVPLQDSRMVFGVCTRKCECEK